MAYLPIYPSKEYLDRCIVLSKEDELLSTDNVLLKYGKKKFETFDEYDRPVSGWTIGVFEDGIKRVAPGVYDPTMYAKWSK